MISRRSLLTSMTTLPSAALAGCASFLETEIDRRNVSLYNGDTEPHNFVVIITNEDGEEIFNREYELGDRSADEDRIIDGTPAEITVAIDDTEPVQFPWTPQESVNTIPKSGCAEKMSTSLDIYYGRQADEEITPIYDCAAVRDQ